MAAPAEAFKPPDPALLARVAALRQLSFQDAVPNIVEVVARCLKGEELAIPRAEKPGLGQFLRPAGPLKLSFETPDEMRVDESAVVLALACASLPAELWRNKVVVDVGCGNGFLGVVLAALGARVTLTDLPRFGPVASSSIARNARAIRAPGSAAFCEVDWARPRSCQATGAHGTVASAAVAVVAEPVKDSDEIPGFVSALRALLGIDGEAAVCPRLDCVLVAHKHTPTLCIGGYASPDPDAKPSVVKAEQRCRCLLLRSLADGGLRAEERDWLSAPELWQHPFVECWEVTVAPQR